MGQKLVYLDEEGVMMWGLLVNEKYNMSKFIKEAIRKELESQKDTDYLTELIHTKLDEKVKLDNEIKKLRTKLDKIIKDQTLVEEKAKQVDRTHLIQMTNGIIKSYGLDEPEARKLALEYLVDESKPTLREFMNTKGIQQAVAE